VACHHQNHGTRFRTTPSCGCCPPSSRVGRAHQNPAATLEGELSERKSFIQSADLTDDAKNEIAASLDAHSGLGSFSKLIKSHGLSQMWHRRRFQAVVRRIRAWCTAVGIPWRENGCRRATRRNRQLKREMIYQLRISAIYSSDSSSRSPTRTYVESRYRSI